MEGNRLNHQAAPVAGVHTCLVSLADWPEEGVISLMFAPAGWTCRPVSMTPRGEFIEVKLELLPPSQVTVDGEAEA